MSLENAEPAAETLCMDIAEPGRERGFGDGERMRSFAAADEDDDGTVEQGCCLTAKTKVLFIARR